MTMQVDKARLDEMDDLIERLTKGVVNVGTHDRRDVSYVARAALAGGNGG